MKKSLLITGGNRGIGRATALEFAKKNDIYITINYLEHLEQAESLKAELEPYGAKVLLFQADVSNEEQVKAMIDTTLATFGSIDVLVNNAGIVFDKEFEARTVQDWQRTLEVNLLGPFLMAKYAGEQMMKQQR
jgi:3-oxoacyl-[acyl-carrier protein] reductase